ncbi:MAG: hypothetical protein H8E32_06025, partial [Nitrospinae bacterium]|nr:hypothetical protein [Nitrospinota bacterium]
MGLFSKNKKSDSSEGNGSHSNETSSNLEGTLIAPGQENENISESSTHVKRRSVDIAQIPQDARGRRSSDRSRPVINKIVSGESMGKILFSLTEELKDLFDCQAVTV